MRLGFDLDGTVADLHGALAREAERLFPEVDPASLPRSIAPAPDPPLSENEAAAPPPAPVPPRALTPRQQRELWNVVCARENFWETLDEIEAGSLARLFHVAQARRWDVIFLTSRPESAGDTAQLQSHRWLAARGFELPSVFVVRGSRGKIAAALGLDIVVDDRPENCLDVAIDSSARPILLWRGDADKVPSSARQLGIGSIGTMAECLDILEAIDQAGSERGMIERLRRLLRLKPRAARTRTAGRGKAEQASIP